MEPEPIPPTNPSLRLPGLPTSSRSRPSALLSATPSSQQNSFTATSTNQNVINDDQPISPRPEDLKPMGNVMKARLYSYGGSNSMQVAQRASGLGTRPLFKKENSTRPPTDVGYSNSKIDEPWGAYPNASSQKQQQQQQRQRRTNNNNKNGSFIARRPSPSGKSMQSANLYSKRGGRRLRSDRSTTDDRDDGRTDGTDRNDNLHASLSAVTFASNLEETINGPEYNGGLNVPYGMADSNPDAALLTYNNAQFESYKEEEEENKTGGQKGEHKSTTRGDLLRQAQNFKTFMEIMEEHPLYEMPYGDSFLYLKSRSGST
tara:strand:+ start:103 stop:1053 length:951 start_codon:yes stop_codon:yes gene_type:complete